MTVFKATFEQTAILFCFIAAGYLLAKCVPEHSQTVLSRLENNLFIPALVLGTFLNYFTAGTIRTAWKLLLGSLALAGVFIVISLACARLCTKDRYERNIYLYGLCFSNFGYMGNAVVSALFPDIFLEYLIFTLPLWTMIYLWGVPVLLLGDGSRKPAFAQRMKNFVNPMFVSMVLGMLIGLLGIPVPAFLRSAISTAGSCMSPLAMLLTGMTIAHFNLRSILKIKGVYLATLFRLLLFPLLFLGFLLLVPLPETLAVCALCSLAMPLGLNTVIIPGALGRDTRAASGMALVSHGFSCLTIPLVVMLLQKILA